MGIKYPEHERLSAIAAESQIIGEFLEWLQNEREIHLGCVYNYQPSPGGDINSGMALWIGRHEDLLAQFFGIDRDKIEAEKRQMLEELRAANAAADAHPDQCADVDGS